ncbi:Re/Si-specific NAD(P)(+) transhydrogenase subunit alpha [Methanoregula sp. UBA64]|jgi:H+-translocating NAD(P) transhydrogenase subunit alpha|uniref:Re/Si-specific NAD(P)(+) transhydrogenase subunit alpha n=1 Tax=Methanoregula sp. UBA64 TaxID=1915554 RepID=UPI0025CCFEFA|nr:Re/Si-specific NAD(P)(+) transhydrogenase subunit alpha [Methanoregula sp. UBA64]
MTAPAGTGVPEKNPVVIAVPKETIVGEQRVATVPEVVQKLVKAGHAVRIEHDAGTAAFYPDALYTAAGATVVAGRHELFYGADIVLFVQPPTVDVVAELPEGTIAVGFMNPTRNLDAISRMRDRKITAFALELVPRITRAQSMDALSSQATAGGYVAAVLGANNCPKFLPMLTTAAGTIRPATVLILGAGVAGLMAIATAKRLGALVEAYDVRRAAGEQVRSLGAKFIELEINAEGQGGYARELTAEEKVMEQEMVSAAVARADIVITTAAIPGRKAPVLVTKETVAKMKPGAVIIDMAAETGGNCELTEAGKTVHIHGVTIIGPSNLPARVPFHASQMLAKNLQAFLGLLFTKEGALVTEYADEILKASMLVHAGTVTYQPAADLLKGGKA